MFEIALVNEPSVFKPLKVYCMQLQRLRPALPSAQFNHSYIGVGTGGGGGGPGPPNNLRGGANIPFGPPNNPPTFSFNFYVKQGKNHKCTKLKRKIIINVTLI